MDDLKEYIECPLMSKKIEDGICFDIFMYAEEIALGQFLMRYCK